MLVKHFQVFRLKIGWNASFYLPAAVGGAASTSGASKSCSSQGKKTRQLLFTFNLEIRTILREKTNKNRSHFWQINQVPLDCGGCGTLGTGDGGEQPWRCVWCGAAPGPARHTLCTPCRYNTIPSRTFKKDSALIFHSQLRFKSIIIKFLTIQIK